MNKAFSVAAVSLIALVLAVFSMATSPAAEPEQEKKPSFWMKKKLEYSEAILVGLANGDYDSIGKTARSMGTLSQMEKWVRSSLPEYRAQLQIFQNANHQLIRMADDENLDGATLAYVQLTLSCVNCHKIVRDHAGKAPAETK